jgi:hypothetical protein
MTGDLAAPTFGGAPRGVANVRLFDASAFVEAPLGDGGAWDVAAAGRYGYPSLLLSIFAPNLSLGYGDYTVRVAHRLGTSDTLSLLFLGGYDHETDTSGDLPPIDSQFHRVDLRLDHTWDTGRVRVATTFGYDRTAGTNINTAGQTDAATSTRLRMELVQRFGDTRQGATLLAGADASATHYTYAAASNGSTSALGGDEMLGAYASLRVVLAPGVEVMPGVRIDDTHRPRTLPGGSGVTVDPRFSARVALTPDISWIATLGVAHQEPSYVLPIPGVVVSSTTGFQKVDQLAGGFEWSAKPVAMTVKLTGFYNAERDVSDFIAACGELLSCGPVGSSDGRTYGVELLVRRDLTERLGGWLSYTLSRAERYLGNVPYLSPFDRTHELSAVLHYDLGGGFTAGVRATYYTGRPDFPTLDFSGLGGAALGGLGSGGDAQIAFGPGQIAQHRLPSYYRLDWRVDKSWSLLAGRLRLTAVAEFFNTTLTKEAIEFLCNPEAGRCSAQYVGPIALPSIGVEGRW